MQEAHNSPLNPVLQENTFYSLDDQVQDRSANTSGVKTYSGIALQATVHSPANLSVTDQQIQELAQKINTDTKTLLAVMHKFSVPPGDTITSTPKVDKLYQQIVAQYQKEKGTVGSDLTEQDRDFLYNKLDQINKKNKDLLKQNPALQKEVKTQATLSERRGSMGSGDLIQQRRSPPKTDSSIDNKEIQSMRIQASLNGDARPRSVTVNPPALTFRRAEFNGRINLQSVKDKDPAREKELTETRKELEAKTGELLTANNLVKNHAAYVKFKGNEATITDPVAKKVITGQLETFVKNQTKKLEALEKSSPNAKKEIEALKGSIKNAKEALKISQDKPDKPLILKMDIFSFEGSDTNLLSVFIDNLSAQQKNFQPELTKIKDQLRVIDGELAALNNPQSLGEAVNRFDQLAESNHFTFSAEGNLRIQYDNKDPDKAFNTGLKPETFIEALRFATTQEKGMRNNSEMTFDIVDGKIALEASGRSGNEKSRFILNKDENGRVTLAFANKLLGKGGGLNVYSAWNFTDHERNVYRLPRGEGADLEAGRKVMERGVDITKELNPTGAVRGIQVQPKGPYGSLMKLYAGGDIETGLQKARKKDSNGQPLVFLTDAQLTESCHDGLILYNTSHLIGGVVKLFEGTQAFNASRMLHTDNKLKNMFFDQSESELRIDISDLDDVVKIDEQLHANRYEQAQDTIGSSMLTTDQQWIERLGKEIANKQAAIKTEKDPDKKRELTQERTMLLNKLKQVRNNVHIWSTANAAFQLIGGVQHLLDPAGMPLRLNAENDRNPVPFENLQVYTNAIKANIDSSSLTGPEKEARKACLDALVQAMAPLPGPQNGPISGQNPPVREITAEEMLNRLRPILQGLG